MLKITTSVLLDFVLPAVIGLAIFGGATWFAHSYILNPNLTDYGAVYAGSTSQVTATVQAQNISITAPSDGAIAYGVLALGGSANTVTLGDTQTATNDGNITEDFEVQGGTTANWALGTDAIGADVYLHEFAADAAYATLDDEPTGWKLARNAVPTDTSATFDFRITVPSSDSSNGATQNANINLRAVAN